MDGFALVIGVPTLILVCAAAGMMVLAVTGVASGGAGMDPSVALAVGVASTACCCLSISAYTAWAKNRCPNGCTNVFAGE